MRFRLLSVKRVDVAFVACVIVLSSYAANIGRPASATPATATSAAIDATARRHALERAIASALVSSLNAERRYTGLPPLRANAKLVKSAHGHNVTMDLFNTMSHQLPGESFFAVRMTLAGYTWRTAGENIAWSTDATKNGALSLERQMYREKPPNDHHRLNITSRTFRDVGIDILIDPHTHKMWMTEDFGQPR